MRRESVRRLVVRGPNWIGDAVMCEPAFCEVRRLFPAAEITVLVKPTIAELLAHHPAVDHRLVYEDRRQHAGLAGKWALAEELRRRRFDLAILFQNAFEAALISFLAGIPRRYGYATDGRGWLLTDPIERGERTICKHQVQYYLDLLRPLGAQGTTASPRLFLSEPEERHMAARLAERGVGAGDFVIGLNPGSTYGGAKRWLPDRFAETAERLAGDQTQCGRSVRVVIVGAKGEETLGQSIAERLHVPAVVLSGQTTVRELMAVTKRCDLFLTNDTGPMHIAAAFGVPVVAVFGPTDHRTTSPVGGGHTIVRQPVDCAPCLLRECPIDHRCMTRVTVDEVYAAAGELLEKQKTEGGRPATPSPAASSRPPSVLQGVTVFLDRDGTVNRDTSYIKRPEELEVLPGVVDAVARLKRAGARIVLVTNQSGVARGFFSVETLKSIHAKLLALLEAGGGTLDAMYFCPHHPDDGCSCRKPGTAMVERAAADLGLDLSASYVVGDQTRDIELGRRIGARTVLVTTGPTSQEALAALEAEGRGPDHVAPDLAEAAAWILDDVSSRTTAGTLCVASRGRAESGQGLMP
ncbi:MAG: lipopolysaccharide heptosyltransferase II [Nitrospirota bacterium]|nr:lipopolysaccharide heptosyltransferase II [Nitrospirota bacterium]MDE3242965.1 lipopolysaccharide heptosyltransferase II [Nitrospirota bacterium]